MGFRLRKSINLGGARINLSKSGVGYSFGAKGMRITKCTNGRTRNTVGIPGTGITYVSESGKTKRKVERKEKQIKKSGIVVVSAEKAIVRNSAFGKDVEVSKTAILISYHLVDYLAYICLVSGVIVFFAIPIAGLFIILLSKLLFDISAQYRMILKLMESFKSGNEK